MPARLRKALRDALLFGAAILVGSLIVDYLQADVPNWGLHFLVAGAFAVGFFGLRFARLGDSHHQSDDKGQAEHTTSK